MPLHILRGVDSRTLDCGCLAGLYETYRGTVIAVIDAREPTCSNPAHRFGATINLERVTNPHAVTPLSERPTLEHQRRNE